MESTNLDLLGDGAFVKEKSNYKIEDLNIPIYRGKKIGSYEYVEGLLKTCTDTGSSIFWIQTKEWIDYQIDPTTLAIHFKDMKDSQGNKIFASLSESGKGGDIVESYHYTDYKNKEHKLKHIAKWSNKYNSMLFANENSISIDDTGNGTGNVFIWTMKNFKTIGIQK